MPRNAQKRQAKPLELPTNVDSRRLLEVIPAAAYTTDAEGLITDFNQRAVALWGREPKRNDPSDRF